MVKRKTATVTAMAPENEKAPSDLSLDQIPPCDGCPSRIYVFMNGLDASHDKLALAVSEVASLRERSSVIQLRTVSALSRVRH